MTTQEYDSKIVLAPIEELNNYDAITETTRCINTNTTSNKTNREFKGDDSRR